MTQYLLWSAAEADYLDSMAGDVPFPELVQRFQQQARRQRWPYRSKKAILTRLRRTGQCASARCGQLLTTGTAARLLGCPGTRVESWIRRPRVAAILQPRRVGTIRYIERSAWRQLAREMPRVLGGFPAGRLFLLLEDRALAEAVAARYRRPCGDWRVRCVETGRIYASCGAAAAAHHVTQSAISLAIRQRRKVVALGLTFQALRQPQGNAVVP